MKSLKIEEKLISGIPGTEVREFIISLMEIEGYDYVETGMNKEGFYVLGRKKLHEYLK